MGVKDRLETAYRLLGYEHLSELAEAVGVKPGTAQQQANRGNIPIDTAKKYVERGRGIGLTLEWLLYEQGPPPRPPIGGATMSDHRNVQIDAPGDHPSLSHKGLAKFTGDARGPVPVPRDGEPDLKVYRLVSISGGVVVLSTDPVALAPRPDEVSGVPDAFGVYVATDEMEPAYSIGDFLCISPALPPTPGKDVLLMTGRPGEPDVRTALRRLSKITETHWICLQFNPARTERFSRAEWQHAPRVVLRRIP
jgi:hypothetical protein